MSAIDTAPPISYSAHGAAAATGLSASFIREAHRDGDLAGKWANTKLIIKRDALEAWVDSLPDEKPTR